MSLEMWAVPLAFTCMVVMFAYVANEVVRLVHDWRTKCKTLHRLSAISIQLAGADELPAYGRPVSDYLWSYVFGPEDSTSLAGVSSARASGELLPDSGPVPGVSEDSSISVPAMGCALAEAEPEQSTVAIRSLADLGLNPAADRHAAVCPTSCRTQWVWGNAKGSPQRRTAAPRTSRRSAATFEPARTGRKSKTPAAGRWNAVWARARSQAPFADESPANKRQEAIAKRRSLSEHRTRQSEFTMAASREQGHSHSCRVR